MSVRRAPERCGARVGLGSASAALIPAIPACSKCWGGNNYGQLGLGDTNDRGDGANEMGANLPNVDLGAGWTVVQVAVGGFHTCARLEDGAARALKCWGSNSAGKLGLDDANDRGDGGGEMGDSLPAVELGTGRSAVALALGDRHSCAVLDDASVKCWGHNDNGQLGLGDTTARGDQGGEMGDSLPSVDLGPGRTAVQLAVGGYHTCALLDDASVKCWGWNSGGYLGLGDTNDRGDGANEMGTNLPSVDLGAGWTVIEVAAGYDQTCARLEHGAARALKCWGLNGYGQLGRGNTNTWGDGGREVDGGGEMGHSLPSVQFGTGRWAIALALGCYHSCAWLDDASVKCWGSNRFGRLGLGDANDRGEQGGEMGDSLPSVPLCMGPCPVGYTGPDGWSCAACAAGTYTVTGSGTCAACPSHSSSAAGSDELVDCACDAGYTGPDGGACEACSDCDSVITFTATLAMSREEFTGEKQDAYISGVARALSVVPSRVNIASIMDQSTRRRLLAASIAVLTIATVSLEPFRHTVQVWS